MPYTPYAPATDSPAGLTPAQKAAMWPIYLSIELAIPDEQYQWIVETYLGILAPAGRLFYVTTTRPRDLKLARYGVVRILPSRAAIAGNAGMSNQGVWTNFDAGYVAAERAVFVAPATDTPMDVAYSAAHETGHALGLFHSSIEGNLMNPVFSPANRHLTGPQAQQLADGFRRAIVPH